MAEQPKRKTRESGVMVKVYQYMQRHPGEVKLLADIAADLNLEPKQVQSAMSRIKKVDASLQVMVAGNAWKFLPGSGNDKPLFEEIGRTKKGVRVLEDTEGNLFRAVEIKD